MKTLFPYKDLTIDWGKLKEIEQIEVEEKGCIPCKNTLKITIVILFLQNNIVS